MKSDCARERESERGGGVYCTFSYEEEAYNARVLSTLTQSSQFKPSAGQTCASIPPSKLFFTIHIQNWQRGLNLCPTVPKTQQVPISCEDKYSLQPLTHKIVLSHTTRHVAGTQQVHPFLEATRAEMAPGARNAYLCGGWVESGWDGKGEKYLSRGQGWRRRGSLSMLHYPRVPIRCFYPQQKGNTAASEEGTEIQRVR